MVQALVEGAVEVERLLVFPVDLRAGKRLAGLKAAAGVVARDLSEELVPWIETGGDVPHRLRHRQEGVRRADQIAKPGRDACTEEAMVVVDEPHDAVVDALVIRDVRIRRLDADRFAQHLGEWPAGADKIVEHAAGANLIAVEDTFLELFIEAGRLRCVVHGRGCHALPPGFRIGVPSAILRAL